MASPDPLFRTREGRESAAVGSAGITVFCVIRITGYSPQATLIARNQFQAHASWSAACSLSKLDVGTIEFEDALGVAADEDAILFDKNAIGVKTRSVWGVQLVGGFAIPILIKTQKAVMQRDPNFAG